MPEAIATIANSSWLLSGQVREDEPVRSIRIDCSPFRVGRRTDLALSLSCGTVSSLHAELTVGDSELRVRDLGSTNGTFVNGVRVEGERVVRYGDLLQFAEVVFRVGQEQSLDPSRTVEGDTGDRALALIQFDKLMAERAVVPYFQPIIEMSQQTPIGYEVLGRSRVFGLTEPKAMFHAAAVLGMENELSRMFRHEGLRRGSALPPHTNLFVNTHPAELVEYELLEFSLRELRDVYPDQRITLEIHEAAVTNPRQMQQLRVCLQELGIALAYDDFGAGQARLVELAEVPPDYIKFDLHLILGIESASEQRQNMLAHLVKMVTELGIQPVAEGVETPQAHEVCKQLGFLLGQGFFYGKPAPVRDYCK